MHTVRTERPRSQLQRADDLSIVGFAEGLQGLSADVSLRSQAENCLRICFIIRRLDYADQVVAAHRQVSVLNFNAGLLKGFAASVQPARTVFNTCDSLACPVQQCNVSWHLCPPWSAGILPAERRHLCRQDPPADSRRY